MMAGMRPMSPDLLVRIGPLIGGAILMGICGVHKSGKAASIKQLLKPKTTSVTPL
jgi:hypothetical protein